MAFADIPLGRHMKIDPDETEIMAFVGEPEMIKNNFGEIGPVITVYHLTKNEERGRTEWICRQWPLSQSSGIKLQAIWKKNGCAWPDTAFEVERTGESTSTKYAFKPSSIKVPPGLKPLTKEQMESKKGFERDPIPAEGGDVASSSAAAPKADALRAKYRVIYGKASDAVKADLAQAFGGPDDCKDSMLGEAIAYAQM